MDHHEGGQARADRDREIRRGDLLNIKLDHHVFGDLAPFGGAILQSRISEFNAGRNGYGGEMIVNNLHAFVHPCDALMYSV